VKSIETIETYPLSWPTGIPRTTSRSRSRFGRHGNSHTIHNSRTHIRDEVRRLGGSDLIISTDQKVRSDGEPMAAAKEPEDSGIAIYFKLKGKKVCLACDRWKYLWENVYAIAQTIAAMRAIDRWGVSDLLDRMFTGFVAISPDAGKNWAAVLRVPGDASVEEIKTAYRKRMKEHHPDVGGDPALAAEINNAFNQALKEKGIEHGN
jgi:hypothetical protein